MKSEYKSAEEANKKNDMDTEDPEKASTKFPIVINLCAITITCAIFLSIVIVAVVISAGNNSSTIDIFINGTVVKFKRTRVGERNVYKFVPHWVHNQVTEGKMSFRTFFAQIG